MGSVAAATSPPQPFLLRQGINHFHNDPIRPSSSSRGRPDNSMSQGFHQGGAGVYGFSDDHRRDKQSQLRTGSFVVDPTESSLIGGAQDDNDPSIYDVPPGSNAASGILISDMFAAAGFPGNPGVVARSATDLLVTQISAASNEYRFHRQPTGFCSSPGAGDWYGAASRQQQVPGSMVVPSGEHSTDAKTGGGSQHFHHQGLQSVPPNAAATTDSSAAAAMRLFLSTNPQASTSHQHQLAAHHQQQQQQQHHQRSQSPPSPSSAAALPPTAHTLQHQTSFHSLSFGSSSYGSGGGGPHPPQLESGQGLSLSLSSSLQQFELGRPDEFRNRDRMLYYSDAAGVGGSSQHNSQQPGLHLLQQQQDRMTAAAAASNLGVAAGMSVLRRSKYTRAAQELLEEFCSVGKGAGSGRSKRLGGSLSNPNPSSSHAAGGGVASSSTSPKAEATPALSPADRFEQQRRKAKLLAMLDEVERRYQHYCEQMQMVVNSYDSIMGFGASTPYTALAQRAMSRHFRCLKDAITGQLKKACELLGDKDVGVGGAGGGITKGETPKLKVLDQSLRQQRAFHQMGMMEHEAWRPQRGLPERSVNVLRGWLFEHFLHPYPSDADKHLLARQTGLSRNQVSNWFINARVRLWKPMVEEMYLMESKGEEEKEEGTHEPSTTSGLNYQTNNNTSQSSHTTLPSMGVRQQHQLHHRFGSNVVDALDSPQLMPSAAYHSDPVALGMMDLTGTSADQLCGLDMQAMVDSSAAHVRFGATGDVSLTLGLRHPGNTHDGGGHFSVRDFGEC